jgi:signal transduction histidine kinase
MRERWRQLGGTLEIISTEHGTVVKAMLPEQFSLAKAVGQEAGRDSEFTI